jgi:hypothetical protein
LDVDRRLFELTPLEKDIAEIKWFKKRKFKPGDVVNKRSKELEELKLKEL